MLELASAPPPKPAINAPLASEAARGGKEQAGFQNLLRDALEAAPSEAEARQPKAEQAKADPKAADPTRPEVEASGPRSAENMPITAEAAEDIAAALDAKPGPQAQHMDVEAVALGVLASDQPNAPAESPAIPIGAPMMPAAQASAADGQPASAGPSMALGQQGQSVAALQTSPLPSRAAPMPDGVAEAGLAAEQQPTTQQPKTGPVAGVPGSSGPATPGTETPMALGQEAEPAATQKPAPPASLAAPVSEGAARTGLAAEQQAKPAPAAGTRMASVQEGQPAAGLQAPPLPSSASPASDEPASPAMPSAVQPGLAMQNAPATAMAQQAAGGISAAPAQAAALQASQVPPTQTGARKASAPIAEGAAGAEHRTSPVASLSQALAAKEVAPEVKIVLATEAAEARFHVTGLEAPKPVTARPQAEGNMEALSPPTLGFILPEGGVQRAEAPLQSVALREASAPPPARQLAPVVVSLALRGGDEALTIALDPGELGRVEVSIGQGKEAGQIRIVAERPETLALLQRDQRELDRALNQAGLGDMARSLSFSLASDQGRQQHQGAAHQGGHRSSGQGGQAFDAERPLAPIPNTARSATSLLDIAV